MKHMNKLGIILSTVIAVVLPVIREEFTVTPPPAPVVEFVIPDDYQLPTLPENPVFIPYEGDIHHRDVPGSWTLENN